MTDADLVRFGDAQVQVSSWRQKLTPQGTPPYDPYGSYATPPHSEELCEHFILELSKVFLP